MIHPRIPIIDREAERRAQLTRTVVNYGPYFTPLTLRVIYGVIACTYDSRLAAIDAARLGTIAGKHRRAGYASGQSDARGLLLDPLAEACGLLKQWSRSGAQDQMWIIIRELKEALDTGLWVVTTEEG